MKAVITRLRSGAFIPCESRDKEALKFIIEIDKKLKAGQVGCDPQGQRIREHLDDVVSRHKNK